MKLICIVSLLLIFSINADSYQRVNTTCATNSFWNSQACISCLPGCTCTTAGGCTTLACSTGQAAYTTGNTCVDCPLGCNTCTISSGVGNFQCQTCSSGYQLIQTICVQLSTQVPLDNQAFNVQNSYYQPYAQFMTCASMDTETTLCDSCPSGSWLNEITSCEACVSNCASCNSRGTCTTCASNFYWVPNALNSFINYDTNGNIASGAYTYGSGACSQCTDLNAITCNENSLNSLSCISGYYLSPAASQSSGMALCVVCSLGCNSCSSATMCSACTIGYYAASNACTLCTGNLNTPATPTCLTCTGSTCLTCNTAAGYVMINEKCIICSSSILGCASCTASGTAVSCATCANGFYRVLNSATNVASCTPCGQISGQTQAVYCYQDDYGIQAAPIVTQCSTNNWLVPSATNINQNVCTTNSNYCLTMTNSTGYCATCYPGYSNVNGVCQLCSQELVGCTSCTVSTSNSLQCSACTNGMQTQIYGNYVLNTESYTCTECLAACSQCTAAGVCTQCAYGYTLSSGTCQLCEISNCQMCSSVSLNTCTTCNSGYFMYSINGVNQCYACPYGCSACGISGQTCTACLSGFYYSNGGCNAGNQYCAVFNNDGSCSTCQYGFRLSGGRCYACISFFGGYVCGQNAGGEC